MPPSRAAVAGRLSALLLGAAALTLAGCGTVSRADCRAGDWAGIGEADGRAGAAAERIEDHRRSCDRYGLPVDPVRWEEGRQRGLRAYCTPASGWTAGLAGRPYRGVCPPATAPDFLAAHALGTGVHGARATAERAEEEARRVRDAGYRDRGRLDDLRRALDRADGPEERARIRDRIDDIRLDRMGDFGEALRAEREADAARQEARAAEAEARARFRVLFGADAPAG